MTRLPAWKCPRCGSKPEEHGKGGRAACRESDPLRCQGFICDCDALTDTPAHGQTEDDPCENAVCYHCEWSGRMPVQAFEPAKLKGWAKSAWAEGWRPPTGWSPKSKEKR